jgi:flavin reductase (DIM6/NTAB) family NADH-FMN oxidoreductase RutF
MFYETAAGHPLPHDPFKALVAPRPVGWISSVSADGAVNLAPYSFFNAVSGRPPIVMFSSEGRKDSLTFVEQTREFVCNLASRDLADAMNASSAPLPRGQSEFTFAGLEMAPSRLIKPPRVAGAAAALECKVLTISEISDLEGRALDCWLVVGQVIGVHIDERFIVNGRVDTAAMRPIARAGYDEYFVCTPETLFALGRPRMS